MRTLACRAIVSICALGHSAAFSRHADKMPNCADFKDDCATDAFIQKQCAATCGGGAAKAAAPTNERAEHGHSEPLTADSADVAVFAGLGRDVTLAHSDITTICRTDRGGAVVATNPAQPWIPAEGTVEGCVLMLFCKRGRLGEDGRSIEWSNGVTWVLDRRAEPRNKLEEFFYVVPKRRLVVKWDHYLAIYERHLAKFKALGRRPVVLEIGVNDGGSLDMWQYYFDGEVELYGLDFRPHEHLKQMARETPNLEIFFADQANRTFWRELIAEGVLPRVDVVIDDGGHRSFQQITSFEELWPHMNDGGVYLVEDCGTSYNSAQRMNDYWAGGLRRPGTYIEYAKGFVDKLNAYRWPRDDPDIDFDELVDAIDFRREASSVHFYDQIVVLEKQAEDEPQSLRRGGPQRPSGIHDPTADRFTQS